MLTIGDRDSEVTGTVEGSVVYHSSLAPEEYRHILNSIGFDKIVIKLNDDSCGHHSILHARK